MNQDRYTKDTKHAKRPEQAVDQTRKRRPTSLVLWGAVIVGLGLFFFVMFQANVAGGLAVGDPLPPLQITALDGTTVDLDSWRGRGVILRFSTVTCTSCLDDFGVLDDLNRAFGDDVVVAAVQVGDREAGVRTALRGRRLDMPILLDPQGEVARALGVQNVPAFYFITTRGTLSSVVNAEIDRVDMQTHAALMMQGGPGLEAVVREVAMQLRCYECEGRSTWESDAPSSIETRNNVRRMLLEGQRPEEVLDTFESVYGEWVLMAPPIRGFASLAWILPAFVAVTGVGVWVGLLRRARMSKKAFQHGDQEPKEDDDLKEKLARHIDDYLQ